ncbi:MAG: hypothetical protein QOI02_465 [Actinomycetota bacterium]|nr:hypothetical protein [Actinomycetota bacterium]
MTLWADLALDGARRTITLEHRYPTTAGDLWTALVRPARVSRWLGDLSLDGDRFTLVFPEEGAPVTRGRVLDCVPEERLLVSWQHRTDASTELEVTLQAGESDVLLRLEHRSVRAVGAAEYAAGWQGAFGALAALVGEVDHHESYERVLPGYRSLEAGLVPASTLRVDSSWSVHLERLIAAPVADVWDCLVRPDRIGRWLWPVVEWPDDPLRERVLRLGDRFRLGDENMPGGFPEFEVLEFDPQRVLAFTWGNDRTPVRLTLQPSGDGTLLTLDQAPTPEVFAAGRVRSGPDFAAGWHSLVDQLVVLLDGRDPGSAPGLWEGAYSVYEPHPIA